MRHSGCISLVGTTSGVSDTAHFVGKEMPSVCSLRFRGAIFLTAMSVSINPRNSVGEHQEVTTFHMHWYREPMNRSGVTEVRYRTSLRCGPVPGREAKC